MLALVSVMLPMTVLVTTVSLGDGEEYVGAGESRDVVEGEGWEYAGGGADGS